MPETGMIYFISIICLFIVCVILLFILLLRQSRISKTRQEQLFQTERARQDDMQSLYIHLSDSLGALPNRDELNSRIDAQTSQTFGAISTQAQALAQRIDVLGGRFDSFGISQEQRLHRVTATLDEKLTQNEQEIGKMRDTLYQSVGKMQEENGKKLDAMRETVDEKLHASLDKRLNESFSLVNERLEQVYKGLGEMHSLASGVGDLKKVLTNVKTRGVWGEVQLGALLEQVLSKNQYDENVAVVPGSSQRVEYAVILPGQSNGKVYLPIDAKFPIEDYERLQAAQDTGDNEQISAASLALQNAIRTEGKRIAGKYISPPSTTDFAIMFLPIEGLYAEVLRARGLVEELQEKHRIVVAGPTTLNALLTSLQVGFRTLAIEKRSGEVWQLLSAVKTEFSKFSDILDVAQRRLTSVSSSLEQASKKSRTIERKLKRVEGLDEAQAAKILESDETESSLPDDNSDEQLSLSIENDDL